MEEIRKQNQEQLGAGASSQDLSMVMELSKRDEEARLNRLREEEEELEKVCFSINLHYLSILQTDIIRFFL